MKIIAICILSGIVFILGLFAVGESPPAGKNSCECDCQTLNSRIDDKNLIIKMFHRELLRQREDRAAETPPE